MCDTLLATPATTKDRIMLFGKNSDRQRNEAQTVEHFPREQYASDAALSCTYITIPQVRRTHAVLLCRPFWIWGAEMGANEHGVVIGNEGIHARSPAPQAQALIGMDLIRLALERASSAAEAVEVITGLLKQHGQGGNCGHLTPSYYNNSFMIADATEGFVLETVGREWLVERVLASRAISNDYSIGQEVERTSSGMPALLREFGWESSSTPNHARVISDPQRMLIGSACERRTRAASLLAADQGQLTLSHMMRVLRDHPEPGSEGWSPSTATKNGICVHPGPKDRTGQTTGAMASELRVNRSVHWVTGTGAPCISIFKPVLLDAPLPFHGPRPTDRFDPETLWWRHERLYRSAMLADFAQFLADIRDERDGLEREFQRRMHAVLDGGDHAERARVIAQCWQEADEAERRWQELIGPPKHFEDASFVTHWQEMNRLAGLALTSRSD